MSSVLSNIIDVGMLLTYEFDMYKRFLVQICNHKYHNLISLYEWNDEKRASVEQTCATLSAPPCAAIHR